jgi:SAM-dependent methyltransferase
MQKRHRNKEQYFNEQATTTEKHVIPYLKELIDIDENTSVLEIGCGEAGNLKPFLDLGCKCTGNDISCGRIELGKKYFANHKNLDKLSFICEDIYKVDPAGHQFDVIIMRDVIEHIPNQEKFMHFVKQFLKPRGKFFLAFPPWQNPFGGHQQICRSKILSRLPWFHLFPKGIYRFVLQIFGETEKRIEELLFVKETGISIERFKRILNTENYIIDRQTYYFINPNYETKFGLKPRRQIKLISAIPWLRNFFTTAMYFVVSNKK